MADIPAGWYDDPEHPGQNRYWDGTQWTDHRAPKVGTASLDRRSAWSVVPDMFSVLGRHWRHYVVLSVPLLVVNVVAAIAAIRGFDRALNVDVGDLFDRVTQPGFNPNDGGADQAYVDSLRFSPDAGTIMLWVGAGLAALGTTLLWMVAAVRVTVGAKFAEAPDAAAAYRDAVARVPKLVGFTLSVVLLWVSAAAALIFLAVAVPISLLVALPALWVGAFWAIPVMTAAAISIGAGPGDTQAWPTGFGLVKNRWWAFFARLCIVWLVTVAVGLGTSVVVGPFLAASLWGGILVNLVFQVVQSVVAIVGLTHVYLWADGPTDPELRMITDA